MFEVLDLHLPSHPPPLLSVKKVVYLLLEFSLPANSPFGRYREMLSASVKAPGAALLALPRTRAILCESLSLPIEKTISLAGYWS